ncbi:MAG: hypothetical protein O7E52_00755, partial [Candidatus Poribacteria bacterium]|nr:hypothetical protein [Candidatus Poribacteria bacterium]
MTWSRLRNLLIALGAVLLLTFLFVKTRAVNFEAHNRFIGDLRRLKELDATLNQDLLKSRYAKLTDYDPLVAGLAELKRLQTRLKKIPIFIARKGQIEINRRLDAHAVLLTQKADLLERFKSQNAILRNSLSYFPIVATALASRATDREMTTHLNDLLRDVLIYNLTSSEALAPQINAQVEMLLKNRDRYAPSVDGADLDILIAHVKTIRKSKPQVDAVTEAILLMPTSQRTNELDKAYDRHYHEARQTANVYRLFLYLFSVVLLGCISYLIIQLEATNAIIEAEVQKRTAELKKAQNQLILNEKMASLGALTAGIAHEIKNPLNFVNNFAELSAELTQELREEIQNQKENLDPETLESIQEILSDLQQNATKINQHGKRADSIVEGMLLHSRGKSGERRPTDLNALMDEYVKLA